MVYAVIFEYIDVSVLACGRLPAYSTLLCLRKIMFAVTRIALLLLQSIPVDRIRSRPLCVCLSPGEVRRLGG